jgi:RNA polymerase sigma factor (TIGR02999 family)
MVRERSGHILQTTALIDEAFVRLIDGRRVRWRDRSHFFAMAAKVMRRILVDIARARSSQKRGNGASAIQFEESRFVPTFTSDDLVALDRALEKLALVDLRMSKIVELRFFGGLSVKDTAEVLHLARSTVCSDFKRAKIWLLHELRDENPGEASK